MSNLLSDTYSDEYLEEIGRATFNWANDGSVVNITIHPTIVTPHGLQIMVIFNNQGGEQWSMVQVGERCFGGLGAEWLHEQVRGLWP